uniref:Helicase ATP-binding domain-containing protein n=1 Tax=Puccinia triticina (isolate 1-1 / race 1 (BBBD)) TaxID=630390 RepID=A0ABL7D3P8_PUCT1
MVKNQNGALPDLELFQIVLRNCVTKLKEHQITALQFLNMNESAKDSNINDLWNHSVNNWIRNSCDPTNLQVLKTNESSCQGSILADDMGLGKTLTTLELVLATRDLAKTFQTSLSNDQHIHSAATLIICPLATLSNCENEIRIHFKERAIPYMIFHGRDRGNITQKDLLSSLVVLKTYKMVGTSGNRLHTNQITIESLELFWLRIALDEAHMIRNPTANRTINILKLKSKLALCLTGTPFQNPLTDVQSLITLLKISPCNEEWIWRQLLIPGMNVGAQDAIKTLNRLMETVCLGRTKDVLLNIPPKI